MQLEPSLAGFRRVNWCELHNTTLFLVYVIDITITYSDCTTDSCLQYVPNFTDKPAHLSTVGMNSNSCFY